MPVFQEQTQVLVPIYSEPAPKILVRSPRLKTPSPPRERAAPPPAPSPQRERAQQPAEPIIKIVEVEKLVSVPARAPRRARTAALAWRALRTCSSEPINKLIQQRA